MPLIVDAYNVLHMTGVLPPDLSGLDVDELRGVISLSRYRQQRVTLVCDGVPSVASRQAAQAIESHGPHNISIEWSGASMNADSLIELLVAQNSAPRRLVIVTSDRRLGREVRKRRANLMSSERFLETLEKDFRDNLEHAGTGPIFAYDVPLHTDSIRWWNTYFGLDPDRPRIAGRDLPSSPEHITPPDSEPPADTIDRAPTAPPPIEEADSTRWWLRYFGFNPDDLPEAMLVPATDDEESRSHGVSHVLDETRDRSEDQTDDDNDDDDDGLIDIDSIDPEDFLR